MSIRAISGLTFPDIEPAPIVTERPVYKDVSPLDLHVDDGYQRNLSERSHALIRRIVAAWNWNVFSPPHVVITEDGRMDVVDGQHTAIAAASHPEISTIPVQIVVASQREDRAGTFVKLNRDRVGMTPAQMHHALVTAGDDDAVTMQQVAQRAGVRILRSPPAGARFAEGDTLAVSTIGALINRRHALGARKVLDVCAAAKMTPISAAAIRAVELLLFEPEYAGTVLGDDLATTLRSLGANADRDAKLFAAEHRVPMWRGLASVLYRQTRKVRRGS